MSGNTMGMSNDAQILPSNPDEPICQSLRVSAKIHLFRRCVQLIKDLKDNRCFLSKAPKPLSIDRCNLATAAEL